MINMRACLLGAFVVLAVAAPGAFAQERQTTGGEAYQVDYVIKEEGAKLRRCSLVLEPGGSGSFRIGSKTPVGSTFAANGVPTQFQYLDTGLNVNSRVRVGPGSKVLLNTEIEISAPQAGPSVGANPTLSNVRVSVNSSLTPGKMAKIASLEDPSSTRKFDIEATVTLLQ